MGNGGNEQPEPVKRVVSSYRDLNVWQHAMDLAESCYRNTRSFPKEELYGAVAQIRRAAASIPANVAEGNGRENRGEYIQYLRIAQGSLKELETHVLLSQRVDLISWENAEPLLDKCEVVGKMLRALIRSLQKKGRS
jgi:four helix bundle protein